MMYSMKEACVQTGMSYETLKFYCKEGLVPNVKRDSHNYRVFDDRDIKWIQSLGCLKRCGMTLAEMKEYLAYCLEGPSSIPERKEILAVKKEALLASMEKLQKAIDYIDWKQNFYDDVLSGKIEYHSNLISDEEIAQKAYPMQKTTPIFLQISAVFSFFLFFPPPSPCVVCGAVHLLRLRSAYSVRNRRCATGFLLPG